MPQLLQSLQRALALRLAGVILVGIVVLSAGAAAIFFRAGQQAGAQQLQSALDHFRARIADVDQQWLISADLTRTQIEFARLLEGETRQRNARLTAYFASFGGQGVFAHAAIVDANGTVIFRFRGTAQRELPLPAADVGRAWVFGEEDRIVYRAINTRLAVNNAVARLVLYAPVDNALLGRNVYPNTAVAVLWQQRVIAAAPSLDAVRSGLEGVAGGQAASAELDWEAPGVTDSPRLRVVRRHELPMGLPELTAIVAAASLLAAVLGWLVMGRWLRRQSRRIVLVQSAAEGFAEHAQLTPALAARLQEAGQGQADEIGVLVASLRLMMTRIEEAAAEQAQLQDDLRSLNAGLEARVQERTRELLAARDAALSASRAKEAFLANMSHELRTPMNGLLGSLELLRNTPLAPAQVELLGTAANSGTALLAIINEVLDYSKIEAGKLDLVREPFALRDLVTSAVTLFSASAQSKGLDLRLGWAPNAPQRVVGDSGRLRQVLLNLIGNAVKFTERGCIEVRVRPELSEGRDIIVAFEVADTGPGIEREELDAIFDPFVQAESMRRRAKGGTGLGLAICKRLVEAMAGKIDVQSEPGKGATFRFTARFGALADERFGASPLPADVASGVGAAKLSGRVLLVEDNAANRSVGAQMLRSLGVEVTECVDGARAVEQLAREQFDLVLMDLSMPVMDGLTATRVIREQEAERGADRVPIIALSANVLSNDIQACLDAGMDGHVGKPYRREQLFAVIAPHLSLQT